MDDEIDLVKIFLDLWEGKWKIITSTLIAFTIGLGFVFTAQPNYQAITEIRPIISTQLKEYNLFNSSNYIYKSNNERYFNIAILDLHEYVISK